MGVEDEIEKNVSRVKEVRDSWEERNNYEKEEMR